MMVLKSGHTISMWRGAKHSRFIWEFFKVEQVKAKAI